MSLPEQLIDLALKSGVQTAEVYQSKSRSRPVVFEANRLKQLESSQSEGTALRIWREGCPGLAVAYGEVDPQALVEKAIALSQLNTPETPQLSPGRTQVEASPETIVDIEGLVEMGKSAIATLRHRNPDILCSGEFDWEQSAMVLHTSTGLYCEYTDTSLSGYLEAEWVRGDDFLAVYDGQVSNDQLNPDTFIQAILQRLEWAQTNTPAQTGRIPILFTPKAATLLWGTIAAATSGKRIIENSSPWSDRLHEQVASDRITLTQDPQKAPYTCPFDDEGVLTKKFDLITQGRLAQFYSDLTIGEQLEGTTGNGFRPGLSHYPTPSLVNLIVSPGEHSFEQLVKQLDNGIIVDQLLGGGADISGDFSVNVDLGFRVKDGEIVGRVKDTMIAGNVYTALKNVIALGSDADWSGSCYTPSVLVEGLSVTGSP
jgi:PmbA protein